jgi:exodeoxyribonuclease V alpha subunit
VNAPRCDFVSGVSGIRLCIYTGITRGKRLLVLVGQRKALAIAVRNDRSQRRYSGLLASLRGDNRAASA